MSALFLFGPLDAQIVATFGQTVVYSRPASPSFDKVQEFPLGVAIDSGGSMGDPESKIAGAVLVPQATTAIPLGPQKGDLVEITPGFKALADGTYVVQDIEWADPMIGSARLLLRWTGK